MANIIPSVLINANIYNDGQTLLGVGTVELPDFEFMTESLTGLGIAGELDLPVLGHFKSLTMSVKWNSVCAEGITLLAPRSHRLAIYASVQSWNTADGIFEPAQVKVSTLVIPKKSGIGKFEPGKKMEPETEFEIHYLKMSMAGVQRLEIDKVHFICDINGVDYLAEVRSQTGQ